MRRLELDIVIRFNNEDEKLEKQQLVEQALNDAAGIYVSLGFSVPPLYTTWVKKWGIWSLRITNKKPTN